MYETNQYVIKTIENNITRKQREEDKKIFNWQQKFMATKGILKSQGVRLQFFQHRNQQINKLNHNAINEQMKLRGYLQIGGPPAVVHEQMKQIFLKSN